MNRHGMTNNGKTPIAINVHLDTHISKTCVKIVYSTNIKTIGVILVSFNIYLIYNLKNKIMKISASELVKRSASQLLYKELKRIQWKTTPRQFKGNKYADEVVKKNEASAEKRGIINLDDDLLFFCIDLVKDNLFVEIKMVEDENIS